MCDTKLPLSTVLSNRAVTCVFVTAILESINNQILGVTTWQPELQESDPFNVRSISRAKLIPIIFAYVLQCINNL